MTAVGLFKPLEFTVPQIAYCVIHQRQASVAENDYSRILLELTRQVLNRSAEAAEQIRAFRRAQVAQAVKGAGGAASDGLWTLLDSVAPVPSVEGGLELATLESPLPAGRLEQLASNGRQYLTSLGFRTSDGEAPVHHSVLLFTGSWNYDLIEHIVRDEMGIYAYPHLAHTEQLDRVIFFTQNRVLAVGDPLDTEAGEWQPAIFFAKGKPHYDEFRAALGRAMEAAFKAAGLKAISLWQRKLGMGNIFEFELRLRSRPDPDQLLRALDTFASEGGAIGERVASRGRLLLYQRID